MATAEFVGARIEVVRSACPSLVGIVGVCVVERRGVVYIACEESGRVRGVGKGVCVFRVEVGGGAEEEEGGGRGESGEGGCLKCMGGGSWSGLGRGVGRSLRGGGCWSCRLMGVAWLVSPKRGGGVCVS